MIAVTDVALHPSKGRVGVDCGVGQSYRCAVQRMLCTNQSFHCWLVPLGTLCHWFVGIVIFALCGHTGTCHIGEPLPQDIHPAYGERVTFAMVAAET